MNIIITVLIILITSCFKAVFWDSNLQNIYRIVTVAVFSIIFIKYKYIRSSNLPHKNLILYLTLSPLVSVAVKQYFYHENINTEFDFTFAKYAIFPFFFMMAYKKVSENALIKLFTFICLFILLIQIYQNIFPNPLFGVSKDDEGIVAVYQRNNLNRFAFGTELLTIFCMCYWWNRLLKKVTIKNVIIFLCMAASIYLTLTRQFMIATVLMIGFSILYSRKVNKISSILLILAGAVFIYLNFDTLFGDFIYMTKNETYSTDIRSEAIPFFLYQSWKNPIMFIFGHGGRPQEMVDWGLYSGYWYSDIGFFGQLYQYGIIWVLVYFYTVFKIFVKYRKLVPNYIIFYLLFVLICSVYYTPYYSGIGPFVWLSMLYISDLHISNSQKI